MAALKAHALLEPLRVSDVLEDGHFGKIRDEQKEQAAEKCVSVTANKWTHSTYCFDSVRGDLLSSTSKFDNQATEWQNFIDIGAHRIPRFTRKFQGGKLVAESEITDATILASVEPKLFAPPTGAEQVEGCERPDHPKPIRKPEPAYTPEARIRKVQGTVTLFVRIDPQGNVTDIGDVEPLDAGLDSAAMQTIRNEWKFKPATCGGNPVATEFEVEVTFKLL